MKLLFSALVIFLLGLSGGELVEVKVIVPIDPFKIGQVRLGSQPLEIKRVTSARSSPIIVMVDESFLMNRFDRLFRELQYTLPLLPDGKAEIWTRVVGKRHVAFASFPSGWIGYLLARPDELASEITNVLTGSAIEFLRAVADRYSGCGPVRLFWLDSDFLWLDGRSAPDSLMSTVEPFWPLIGDAGITLYPIRTPMPKRGRESMSSFPDRVASLLGAKAMILSGPPGSTLAKAVEESDRSSVLSLAIRSEWTTRRGLPQMFRVMDRGGRVVLYERPLIGGGTISRNGFQDWSEMAKVAVRLFPKLNVSSATLTHSCGGREAGEWFLQMKGVDFPKDQPMEDHVWVTLVKYGSESERRLTERGRRVKLVLAKGGPCLGPLEIDSRTAVWVYSPTARWVTELRISVAANRRE